MTLNNCAETVLEALSFGSLRVRPQRLSALESNLRAFLRSGSRTPYDNKHNARGVDESARRESNKYHSLVALVQRLQKIKFSECSHSLIGECTTQGELVSSKDMD